MVYACLLQQFFLLNYNFDFCFCLQKLYDELLHYRKEYVSASEKLCASRHLSNLPDVSFPSATVTIVDIIIVRGGSSTNLIN